jgi:hypothetical protein
MLLIFLKKVFRRFQATFKYICDSKRAEAEVGDLPPFKIGEVIIKGTTYIVNSYFKKDAKGNVVDKVRRMIEREAENLTED